MTDGVESRRGLSDAGAAAIVVLALAVRVGVGIWRGDALLTEGNGLFYMHELATSLAGGGSYQVGGIDNVFQQPGYVFLLSGGYLALGVGWQGALAVNALVGTALVALVMRVARHLDPRAVVPAGLLAALHPVLVWHGLSIADTTLFSLTLVGWLDAVLAEMRRPNWKSRVAAGVWIGAAFLTRPSLLPLIPVGLVGIGLASRSVGRAFFTGVVWTALALAVTAPWMSRMHGLTDEFPLIGTHGPESVWAANTKESPRATELDSSYDSVSALYVGTQYDVRAFQVEVPPHEAVRRAQGFRDATIEWVSANPKTFAWMCAVRLGRIWDVRYHPTRRWDKPLRGLTWRARVHLGTQTCMLVLALIGLIVLWRRKERRLELGVVVALLVVYSLAHCIGAGYTRVRVPVDPILAALAGCGVTVLVRRRPG